MQQASSPNGLKTSFQSLSNAKNCFIRQTFRPSELNGPSKRIQGVLVAQTSYQNEYGESLWLKQAIKTNKASPCGSN